jgi:hypothetical protein
VKGRKACNYCERAGKGGRFMSRADRIASIVSRVFFVVSAIFSAISCVTTENVRVISSPIEKVVLSPSEDVRVTVRTDEYIMPVAELRTTKTYPEIIEVENKYMRISMVPHRGRILLDYLFKATGSNEFHRNAKPRPILKDNDYVVEFGGYYVSVPWNPRDRQPYDLEYELLHEGPDIVEVHMWGEDPDNKAVGEMWVTVEKDSSLVQVKAKISSKREHGIDIGFNDFTVIAAGGKLTDNCSLIIPASQVTIGQSTDSWMGVEGERVSWPQTWSNWRDFKHLGSFNVLVDDMAKPFSAVINHDTGDTLLKLWEPRDFFDGIHIWSWGKDYKDTSGGEPTVNYENYKESLSIPSTGSIDYVTSFYVLKDMQEVAMADTCFAGWIQAEKQYYEIGTDSTLKIQSQLGSSRDYRNVDLVVSLTDLEGNVVNGIISEPITAVSPSQICSRSWQVDLKGLGIGSGIYILKLEIFDSSSSLLFTTSSLPVSLKQ